MIPDDPMTMFQQGTVNAVPLIVGANGNEGSMFTLVSKLPANAGPFDAILDRDFGAKFRLDVQRAVSADPGEEVGNRTDGRLFVRRFGPLCRAEL